MPLSELQSPLRQVPIQEESLSPEAYVSIEAVEETGNQLTEDDIIILVDGRDQAPDTASDYDNEEAVLKSATICEALNRSL